MTMAYKHANHHRGMAALYTELGHIEEMLWKLNQPEHYSITLKIAGHEVSFVSGRDIAFDEAITSALEKKATEQRKSIIDQS